MTANDPYPTPEGLPEPGLDPRTPDAGLEPPIEGTVPAVLTQDDKLWGMLGHLGAVAGYLGGVGQWVVPLVIFLVYKDKSKFVAFHALQSLIFQLVVGLVVLAITAGTCFMLAIPAILIGLAVSIIGAIVVGLQANNGEWSEYPLIGPWARRQVGA